MVLNTRSILAMRGAISSKSYLLPSEPTIGMKPVALPPGCGRLATRELAKGSATSRKMIGMVRVCCNITTGFLRLQIWFPAVKLLHFHYS